MSISQPITVHYTLGMSNPSSHLFEVEVSFDHLPAHQESVELILPVWRPGRYLVLDFASGVQGFSAADGHGNRLAWQKVAKHLWRLQTGGATRIIARYKVYANEFNQRTRGLNDEHGFVDAAAVFMYAEQFRHLPLTLDVRPYKNWHVTTGLEGNGRMFSASDYDYFIDCPLEIGLQRDIEFAVDGTPHVLSLFGKGNWDEAALVRDISKIVKGQKEFWGEFPYKRYVFLLHCTPTSSGGTEHVNSTVMGAKPFAFKNADSYLSFLSLVSHEYFHTWNVKQLRPKGIHPYDYTKENYAHELWIAEGTTSYYDDLLLVRFGFTKPEKYLESIATSILSDRQRPGNTVQSLTESSFDAWVKYWRSTEQSYNAETDYYGKGSNVSLLLDLEIRRRTTNAKSLDDLMLAMYRKFPLSGPGYSVDDFRQMADELAGGGLGEFFEKFVAGVEPLPWEEYLLHAGLQLVSKDSVPKPWIGLGTTDIGEKTRVNRVVAGSPASFAGLDIGDEIVALNGYRVRTNELTERVNDLKSGDTIMLTVFRNEQLREFKLIVDASPVTAFNVSRRSEPTELQKRIYQSWLGVPW